MRANSIRLAHVATSPGRFPRDGRPQVALMGRSNVGKSSLLNRLLGRTKLARVSKTPGRTRQIHFYMVDERIYLVDLPGFGYARVSQEMRKDWGRLVESYLDQPQAPSLAVHLVDGRHDPTPLDIRLHDALAARSIPLLVALTKADKLSGSTAPRAVSRARKVLQLTDATPVLLTSARTGRGMQDLSREIEKVLLGGSVRVEESR